MSRRSWVPNCILLGDVINNRLHILVYTLNTQNTQKDKRVSLQTNPNHFKWPLSVCLQTHSFTNHVCGYYYCSTFCFSLFSFWSCALMQSLNLFFFSLQDHVQMGPFLDPEPCSLLCPWRQRMAPERHTEEAYFNAGSPACDDFRIIYFLSSCLKAFNKSLHVWKPDFLVFFFFFIEIFNFD